jgi:hypothetical protein
MYDTKERLSLLWIFALLNHLYADVVALFDIAGSRNSFEPLLPMGSDGFGGLDGDTHRHDSGMSTASVQSAPASEYNRGWRYNPCKRFPDLRSASGRMGQAAPAFPEYLFFATIETVATSVIIWRAWTWSRVEAGS